MLVLSYGITKSGSTFAFELCKGLLEHSGFVQRRLTCVAQSENVNFIDYITVPWLEQAIDEVGRDVIAVKTHTNLRHNERTFLQSAWERGAAKVHVCYRDPRDIALSLLDAGVAARNDGQQAFSEIRSLDDAAGEIGKQLVKCRNWLSLDGAVRLNYDKVAFAPALALSKMVADLGLPSLAGEDERTIIGHIHENAFTQKNKAVARRHLVELTEDESEKLLDNIPGGRVFADEFCSS
jgi:hypothetical protein